MNVTWGEDSGGPFVSVTLDCGCRTMARPIDEPWEETRLHDPLHALLAPDGSETLRRLAHGETLDSDEVRREEARVLRASGLLRELIR